MCLAEVRTRLDDVLLDQLHVIESSDGVVRRLVAYESRQLAEALDELDRRWVRLGGTPAVAEMSSKFGSASRDGDLVRVRELLTDDFVSIDRRMTGMGVRDADEYTTTQRISETGERFHTFPASIPLHSERGFLGLWRRVGHGTGAEWEFWAVSLIRDGRLERIDCFDTSDADAAIVRYHELTRKVTPIQEQ